MKLFLANIFIVLLCTTVHSQPPSHGGGGPRPPRPPNGGGGGGGGDRPHGGGGGGDNHRRPGPGPRPGPNSNAQASVNSSILNDLYSIGIELTKKKMNDQENAGKTLLQVANTIRLPPERCKRFKMPNCDWNSKFQQIDGSCNNMNQPWMGKAETPYKRILPPEYDDTLSAPRSRSVNKKPLPNTRSISRAIQNDNSKFENSWTHMGTLFGQFIAHDMTALSSTSDSFGTPIDCPCNSTSKACLSVPMPSNENIMKQSCMQFTRSSATFPNYNCNMGYREQLNLLSSHLDGSQIYGKNYNVSLDLRMFSSGLLKSSNGVTARPYLPKSTDQCSNTDESMMCFKGGEDRTSENLGLTGIQVLFLREHNRIATELANINKNWNDDLVFYETKQIVIGMYQHIIYNEWLVSVLGKKFHEQNGFLPLKNGFFNGYDPSVNPALYNEFAAAALRFGHSLVRNKLNRFDSTNQVIGATLNISNMIFLTDEAYNKRDGGIESIFIGLMNDVSSKYDLSLVDTLQNHLFEVVQDDGVVVAIDLAATNIQRGRDHGFPGYAKYRNACGMRMPNNFQDLTDSISADKIKMLQSVYDDVRDIDLWVGGLAETPTGADVLIGPTFSCIIAKQFKDLKRANRFFYENGPNKDTGTSLTAFTLDQLNEIRKSSMAALICKDFDIDSIQPNVFLKASSSISNDRVSCSSFAKMDLTKWRK